MKFYKHVPKEDRKYLQEQFEDFIRTNKMTKQEVKALKEWMKDGNSAYDNPGGICNEDFCPEDFLTYYRYDNDGYEYQFDSDWNPYCNDICQIRKERLGKKQEVRCRLDFFGDEDLPF